MPRTRGSRTYRIRQLPENAQQHTVASFLAAASSDLGPASNIQVFSVAASLSLYERIPTKTATVVFKETPQRFDDDEVQWTLISEHPEWPRNLIFDIHFIGFTPLNDLSYDESLGDCIAISGLASHAFGSWKERGDSNFMWLRDQLPADIPYLRSIIYGYDTSITKSQSFQSIDDLALAFFSRLRSITKPNARARSLVFFTHSLGGIVLKRAITLAANSGQADSDVFNNVRMIFFFGVPNQGMYMSHLLAMVGDQPNEGLVRELSKNSDYLSTLDIQFSGLAVFRATRFISVYETKRSRTTKEIEPGVWDKSGPYEILVAHLSAIQRGTEPLDISPINEDHSDIVKFSEQDVAYEIVHFRIREMESNLSKLSSSSMDIIRFEGDSQWGDKHVKHVMTKMLQTLYLEETTSRRDQIEPTYSQTFTWIFDDPDLQFRDWLQNGHGIYWIRGKPGSGKSTLMKYLHTDKRTSEWLEDQVAGTLVSCGWFYFHNRGSRIQNSFEGLLHSILHQMLSGQDKLAEIVLPIYLERPEKQRQHWNLHNLKQAFELIVRQERFPLRLYLFLDALDEYEGHPEIVAEFLSSLVKTPFKSMTKVNVCFSSRPWNVFIEEFGTCPGFSIHEWTRDDIWRFTKGRMMAQRSMGQLLTSGQEKEKEDAKSLMSTIVGKAGGVFLWVRLVVEGLLRARIDGASVAELMETVSEMPAELEDYYERIIQQIPQRYRLESYVMFETLLRSERRFDESSFASATDCAFCKTIQSVVSKLSHRPPSNANSNDSSRRFQSRSGGLVEVVSDGTVQFMHQTVKDLVAKPGFGQRLLGQHKSTLQNGYSFLFKYYLGLYVVPRLGVSSQRNLSADAFFNSSFYLETSMLNARAYETRTGLSQTQFVDSIDHITIEAWRDETDVPFSSSGIFFAVQADLRLYVTHRAHRIRENSMTSPLRVLIRRSAQFPQASLGPMCRLLLSLGADQHALWAEKTPFQMLMGNFWQGMEYANYTDEYIDIASAFLEHGQDPNIDLKSSSRFDFFRPCKPLHMSLSRMTRLLLEYGADVNALTFSGYTALDLSIKSEDANGRFWTAGEKDFGTLDRERVRRLEMEIDTVMILLDHGGCITEHGERCLEDFLSGIECFARCRSDYEAAVNNIIKRFRDPPRLWRA